MTAFFYFSWEVDLNFREGFIILPKISVQHIWKNDMKTIIITLVDMVDNNLSNKNFDTFFGAQNPTNGVKNRKKIFQRLVLSL